MSRKQADGINFHYYERHFRNIKEKEPWIKRRQGIWSLVSDVSMFLWIKANHLNVYALVSTYIIILLLLFHIIDMRVKWGIIRKFCEKVIMTLQIEYLLSHRSIDPWSLNCMDPLYMDVFTQYHKCILSCNFLHNIVFSLVYFFVRI